MTREELEKTHPDYDANIEGWMFFMRSYFGGSMYRDGNYLLQHPFESSSNYRRRKETAYFYNYCGPIVDIFVSHLLRKEAKREYGSLTSDAIFNAFLLDADTEGNSFKHFMREAQRFSSIYGRVSIIVDRPRLQASTRAEAERFGIRPYVTLVTPENLIDWSYARLLSGQTVLEMIKVREPDGAFRIWTRDGWELWKAGDDGDVALLDAGWHNLGEVPVVHLYNKRSGIRMTGVSDIQDIADINRNIYYLCSDAREIIENTAFPMLAMPYPRGGAAAEREVGPHNIIQFDPAEPNARPYWLEAPHSSLAEIREWVRQDINEIYRIAKMGGVKASEDFQNVKSGVALELEYQQLYSALSEKADNLEQAERKVLELWARWDGAVFDGVIDYPDDFSVEDLERDLLSAINAQSAAVDSATFKKELQKKIAAMVLPKLDKEKMRLINEEIDRSAAS